MERKPQQQTLSIRISDTLREFLERSKQVISAGRGEAVSTSDVAKILLESAKDDRLDYRLDVAELQQTPTESLRAIRQKWEIKQARSRAEWILLAQYIQVACEELTEDPLMPGPESFAVLLEAFRAVRGLRTERGTGLDRYYLGNLEGGGVWNDRQLDPELVPQVVGKLIHELRGSYQPTKPVFAGRNFYVAVRDEVLPDNIALNNVLDPFMATLYRLAARGHWIREHRPVHSSHDGEVYYSPVSPLTIGALRLTPSVGGDGELSLALTMVARDVIYPFADYPQIREFAAMLRQLEPGHIWSGVHFHASAHDATADAPARFQFRRRKDGVQFSFCEEEWGDLKNLFSAALSEPRLQLILAELSLVYGEL